MKASKILKFRETTEKRIKLPKKVPFPFSPWLETCNQVSPFLGIFICLRDRRTTEQSSKKSPKVKPKTLNDKLNGIMT